MRRISPMNKPGPAPKKRRRKRTTHPISVPTALKVRLTEHADRERTSLANIIKGLLDHYESCPTTATENDNDI